MFNHWKAVFWVGAIAWWKLNGSSTYHWLIQLQHSQVQSLESSILGGSSTQLQYSQVQSLGKSSILGGEAELNGSDPICWSSLLELALHLLLAHCTALGPDGVVISSPGPGLAHRDQGESRGCGWLGRSWQGKARFGKARLDTAKARQGCRRQQ